MLMALEAGNGTLPGDLFCVPVLVKDNFDMVGLATTAGAVALTDNLPKQDAQQAGAPAPPLGPVPHARPSCTHGAWQAPQLPALAGRWSVWRPRA